MERELIEFLRGRLPADHHEFRVMSDGLVIPIGRLAMGVNAGVIKCVERWLDKTEIKNAAKHFVNYGVRQFAGALPKWVVNKPALMWDSGHGLVLLDGRQRTARLFAEGHQKVRALVIPVEEGKKVDIAGGVGMSQPGPISKKLLSATMRDPLPAQLPDSHPFGIGVVLFRNPAVHPLDRVSSRGRLPERPEWHTFGLHPSGETR